ncbi:MAG: hypothetical protein ASARMPREDX12_000494 [Alectoria sarmentosa]|nr:MAG: hypothetical protein ASARMPREDX12_000494 [Alectoria sarmentosa]
MLDLRAKKAYARDGVVGGKRTGGSFTPAEIYLSHVEGQKRKEDTVKAGCLSKETGNQARKYNVKGSFTSAEIYLSHVEGEKRKESPFASSILPSVGSQKLPCDRYTNQAAEAHHSVQTRIPSPKNFGPAQLSYTNWGKTNIASRGEAEENTKDDELGDASTAICGNDHGIKPPEQVSHIARRPTTEEGPCVQDCEQLVAESRRNTLRKSVRRDEGKWYEESALDKKCPCSRQYEDSVLEDPPIRPDILNDMAIFRWLETAAYEQVGNAKEEEEEECKASRCPLETGFGKKTLQHQRKNDATHAPAGGSETRGSGAASVEEVGYGADCWSEDQGGADTAEDGVC